MSQTSPMEIRVLSDFVANMEQAKLNYMVTGSFAMSYYAEPRMTRDIDIVIEINSNDVDQIVRLFENEYYVDRKAISRAVANQSMFNMIHEECILKIDCIVLKDNEFEKKKFAQRQMVTRDKLSFWIIGKEDLVLSKLSWAKNSLSEIQLRDIENILASGFDEVYLQEWIKKLGLEKVWEKTTNGRHIA
jgi:CRISPR/Cas system CSM-associated protein Csm2 small subunit